jgi:hypothetical protein
MVDRQIAGLLFILISSLCIGVGRFTIPGHSLTGWPGLYETLAHLWVGSLLTVVVMKWKQVEGNLSLLLLVVLSALETVMFFTR